MVRGCSGGRFYWAIRQVARPVFDTTSTQQESTKGRSCHHKFNTQNGVFGYRHHSSRFKNSSQDREKTSESKGKAAQEILEPLRQLMFEDLRYANPCLAFAKRFPCRCKIHNSDRHGVEVLSGGNADTRWTQPHSSFSNGCDAYGLWNETSDIWELPCFLLQKQLCHSGEWLLACSSLAGS